MHVVEKSYGFRLESPHDEHGHGDLGTAFALAMLAASELAAKPEIVLRPMFGIGSEGNSTYADGFAARQREYDAEQRELAQDDDPSGLLDAIRDGRASR